MGRVRLPHLPAIAGIVIAAAVAACSAPPPAPPAPVTEATGLVTRPAADSHTRLADPATGYRLGPGDRIRLTVFDHEDLSGEFELDGEGTFAMPLVGEVGAFDLGPRELERRLEHRLEADGYLVEPQVSVEVMNYRPFFILGEIRHPGSYAYVDGMTVSSAITLAGGLTHQADPDQITVFRGGVHGTANEAHLDSPLLPGDVVEVPERSL